MAEGKVYEKDHVAKVGEKDLVAKFEAFCTLAGSKDKTQMTSKASGKLATDCFEKAGFKKYDVKTICDASVFPILKERGKQHMVVNNDNVTKYINKCAHEIAKRKTKNTKIAADDEEVKKIEADLQKSVTSSGPNVKVVKQSATGNVDGMTDTSKYTGAHKERFDESGKGKGIDGRVDKADTSGYVGNYKGDGTYDNK